jgi:hypothetical protein
MYLGNPTLITFSLSIDLNASWLQIMQYGTRLGIPIGSCGDPLGLVFHNFGWRPIHQTLNIICG